MVLLSMQSGENHVGVNRSNSPKRCPGDKQTAGEENLADTAGAWGHRPTLSSYNWSPRLNTSVLNKMPRDYTALLVYVT